MQSSLVPWGRVILKPVLACSKAEWRRIHQFFKSKELADWNAGQPLRMPHWLFKRLMLSEERRGGRMGFAILDEQGQVIGNAELYDFQPVQRPLCATLGVMIGLPERWGQGYGTEAVQALLSWAFQLHQPYFERIELTTFGHNVRAQRAFYSCGFREVSRRTQTGYVEVRMQLERQVWLGRVESGQVGGGCVQVQPVPRSAVQPWATLKAWLKSPVLNRKNGEQPNCAESGHQHSALG